MTTRETRLEGHALDKYAIVSYMTAGGFAEVYRAHDTMLNIDVVVKVLKPSQADPPSIARFREEAMRTANLQQPHHHPNIVEVFAVGESHGYHWLAMRLLHGETLEAALQRGPMQLPEAVRVLSGVAAALDHAHSRSLIHRDVKPSNIFLTAEGGVVLMDFGLVREQHNPAGTATTTIIGTPQYMSPEQIKGEGLSHRSDVYSLGHVAYEVITGRPAFPHESGNTWHVLTQHVSEDPPPMRLPDGRSVPAGIEAAVRRAAAKAGADRWASAGELARALGDASGGGQSRVRSTAIGTADRSVAAQAAVQVAVPLSAGSPAERRRAPHWTATLAAVGGVGLLAVVLMAVRNRSPGDADAVGSSTVRTAAGPASAGAAIALLTSTADAAARVAIERRSPVPLVRTEPAPPSPETIGSDAQVEADLAQSTSQLGQQFEGGERGSFYRLADVRTGRHPGYTRIVWAMEENEGAPHWTALMRATAWGTAVIDVAISDATPIDDPERFAFQAVRGPAGPVLDVVQERVADDMVVFAVTLAEPAAYSVRLLQQPVRVVIDVVDKTSAGP